MSEISSKSISGITSITTPTGVDNQLTLHTNDTTQRVKVTQSGIEVIGVSTFQDIDVDGHTNLDNVSITGFTTITNGNVALQAGRQLQFGSGDCTIMLSANDLQIATHSSSDIVLKSNSGGGNAGNIYFRTVTGGKVFLTGTGGVGIYHDDSSLKIETTNTGAVVTGVLTATSFSGSGADLTGIDTDLVSDTSPQLGGTLDGNGQTANFTANNTGLGIPIGTTGNQPSASSYKGYIRYNDDDDVIYYSDGTSWKKISAKNATLSSISGSIYVGTTTNLTLTGTGFLSSNLVVNFFQSSDSINANVTVSPSSDTSATVAVPAAVYNNVTAGNAVTIKVTNSDGSTSTTVNVTALALPSGGNIYTSGGYRYHKFTSSGTFTQTLSKTVEYLIVAGGGAGGGSPNSNNRLGGGGGAGGLRGGSVSTTAQAYTITIGAGGSGVTSFTGNSGSNSSAFGITSIGGGGGGSGDSGNHNGGNGGSGGGGGRNGSGGSGTSGQGNDGGDHNSTTNPRVQGGGGGAGAAGNNGSNNGSNGNGYGGVGSNAYSTWAAATSSGHSGYFAGGGGAGWHGSYTPTTRALGGNGGGGNGGDSSSDNSNAYGFPGTANTGGGGGGNSTTSPHNAVSGAPNGAAGGSGIVIIRYQL